MITELKQSIKPYIIHYIGRKIPLAWIKREDQSWLSHTFAKDYTIASSSDFSISIEKLAVQTDKKGAQPLWEGYPNHCANPLRKPNAVRTQAVMGNLFTQLVLEKKPDIIVEFGTAFGVSGMYFLAGLCENHFGSLLTFEPNEVWAKLAENNLSHIGNNYTLTIGTFEDNIDRVLPKGHTVDMAFIDAIHTSEFVTPQLEKVISIANHHAIIILDDINFSDDMKHCWEEAAHDDRILSSVTLGDRVGVLELE